MNFSWDIKPRYTLMSCWYRLSRVNGKLFYLDVGIKAYEEYLRKIGMHYDAYIMNYKDTNA